MSIYKGEKLISGKGPDIGIDLIRDLHDPDFSGVITEAKRDVPLDPGKYITYTCPKRGFVSIMTKSEHNGDTFLLIEISNVTLQSSSYVQCPVNKGDVIRITNRYSQTLAHVSYNIVLVPYKAQ